ncbi:MAG: iron ABC transporter permease [Thermodesulfovibrionales bacterium]
MSDRVMESSALEYERSLKKRSLAGLFLIGFLILLTIYSLQVGSYSLTYYDLFKALIGEGSDTLRHVLWDIRLPRMIAAVIAGAGLGVAGAVMQNVLRNPLASPFTIGVSQGAAFGAAFAIIFFGAGQTHMSGTEGVTVYSPYIIVLCAFCGSLISVTFILLLSALREVTPEALILAGVALSAFFGALTMFIQYFASDIQVAATVFWTFGDIGKAGWRENGLILAVLLVVMTYFISNSWNYNVLQWGDESAKGLGVSVKSMRIGGMLMSSLIVSVITAFLGIIGFIGLIAPHIIRLIIGNDYRFLIPYSAIFGGFLLLFSDVLARTLLSPVVIPVGIITSFMGAPMFIYILIKGKRV